MLYNQKKNPNKQTPQQKKQRTKKQPTHLCVKQKFSSFMESKENIDLKLNCSCNPAILETI